MTKQNLHSTVSPSQVLVWTIAGYYWVGFMWKQAYTKSTSQD
jgi:hypothetical protein